MSFVSLGGDDSSLPTYIEVVAADRLVPSLKAATVYTLSVLSQRHPWVHKLLDFEDEVFALVTLILDWHSLATVDATFAESLYGLRRRARVAQSSTAQRPQLQQQGHASNDIMTRRQRRLSLVLQVLLPYLRSKCDRLYKRLLQQQQHAGAGGHAAGGLGVLGLAWRNQQQPQQQPGATGSSSGAAATAPSLLHRTAAAAAKAYVAAWPWAHAGMEGVGAAFHLAYLLGGIPTLVPSAPAAAPAAGAPAASAAPAHRFALHVLGLHLARVSTNDMVRMEKDKAAARAATLAALTAALGPWRGAAALVGAAARGLHLLSDHSRSALILAVFGFKGLEWWFTSAEERLAASKALPPPPPPPPAQPSPLGVGLPEDPSLCPVCKQRCNHPAQVATSGYVACYKCAFNYVMAHGCCPVTRLPATLDHVRRLYDD